MKIIDIEDAVLWDEFDREAVRLKKERLNNQNMEEKPMILIQQEMERFTEVLEWYVSTDRRILWLHLDRQSEVLREWNLHFNQRIGHLGSDVSLADVIVLGGEYDLITCLDWEKVSHKEHMIQQIYKALKPGGLFVVKGMEEMEIKKMGESGFWIEDWWLKEEGRMIIVFEKFEEEEN